MLPLAVTLSRLERHYGEPHRPPARGLFELVLWENACYLLPDDRRAAVFEGLRQRVGLTAAAILGADRRTLLELATMGGMRPEVRVSRWLEIARITTEQFGGNLESLLLAPWPEARKALKLFPTIGDPGAEKLLLFCGVGERLALDSNGLRVLLRVGFGQEMKNYAASYRSVQQALSGELPRDAGALANAHLLLRSHGKSLCRDKSPRCQECPLADGCAFARNTTQ